MAEEIDLEKCNFRNFLSSMTLTLTLDRVEVTLVCISGRGLSTHQIRSKLEKLFVDGHTWVPIYEVIAWRWPKNQKVLQSCPQVRQLQYRKVRVRKIFGVVVWHRNFWLSKMKRLGWSSSVFLEFGKSLWYWL